jgi:hypothetical protein
VRAPARPARSCFSRDLRFGPIFFLVSPWRAGDVTHLTAMLPARKQVSGSFSPRSRLFRELVAIRGDTPAAADSAPCPTVRLDHVGYHARRSMRARICRKRVPVK